MIVVFEMTLELTWGRHISTSTSCYRCKDRYFSWYAVDPTPWTRILDMEARSHD